MADASINIQTAFVEPHEGEDTEITLVATIPWSLIEKARRHSIDAPVYAALAVSLSVIMGSTGIITEFYRNLWYRSAKELGYILGMRSESASVTDRGRTVEGE